MDTIRRPPGRYDEKRPLPQGALIAGGAVLGLALLALAYFGYERFSTGRVRFGTVAYQVVDDQSVTITFQVDKALTESVRCALQARDRDNTVVGRLTVDVGPSDRESVRTKRSISTTGRAATGEVVNCTLLTGSSGTSGPNPP